MKLTYDQMLDFGLAILPLGLKSEDERQVALAAYDAALQAGGWTTEEVDTENEQRILAMFNKEMLQ
jgi:hypothetical protein